MSELTSQQIQKIKDTRAKIEELESQAEFVYDSLVQELNLNKNVEDWFFDYMFNGINLDRVIEKINESWQQEILQETTSQAQ